jgi:UDP-glucose 4-epimerase
MKNRCVVTGGAGFIGSALVRGILASNESGVTVIDNLATGHEENLDDVRDRVDLLRVDIRDYHAVKNALTGAELVFHLAAIPSVPKSIKDPVPSHETNIDGTFNVLQAASETGVRRLVYAASSSAYGDTEVLPKVETMAPRPKSPYAVQKLLGEYYASVFTSCFGLETVALRFFNVYGPRQDPNSPYSGVLSIFMRCILEGKAPVIYGDGEQTRDFTFVDDVVALILKASRAGGHAVGNVYNAGNGSRYSLNQVWRTLGQITGVNMDPQYSLPREGDVRDSQADTEAAVRDLGHEPRYTLEEGLRVTFEWYRRHAATVAGAR